MGILQSREVRLPFSQPAAALVVVRETLSRALLRDTLPH